MQICTMTFGSKAQVLQNLRVTHGSGSMAALTTGQGQQFSAKSKNRAQLFLRYSAPWPLSLSSAGLCWCELH